VSTLVTFAVLAVLVAAGAAAGWWAGGRFATTAERLDPTTPVRAAVLAYLLFYVFGSVVLLVTGESADGAGPLLAGWALATFGLGAALVRRIVGPPPAMNSASSGPLSVIGVAALAFIGLVAIGSLIAQYGIPLTAPNPQINRSGFAGPVFDVFRWLVPPAALAAFAAAIASGRTGPIRLALIGLIAVAGLEILLASRALPFELAIEALLIAFWAGRRPSRSLWMALAAAGLVVFVGVQLVRVGSEGGFTGPVDAAGFAVKRTVDRVLLIHPRTLEVVAEAIPAEEPYFAGSTYVRRLAVILGQPDRPTLGYWIYDRLFPTQPGGFAAPGVAGEAWANGGPIFVAVVMAALGALAAWLTGALARLPGGPADRTFAALVVVTVARTYATSLNGFVLTLVVSAGWWIVASGRLGRAMERVLDRAPRRAPSGL
jgi:hypothetical protein